MTPNNCFTGNLTRLALLGYDMISIYKLCKTSVHLIKFYIKATSKIEKSLLQLTLQLKHPWIEITRIAKP